MEERRKHPQECLRQEDWGEIKEFVRDTREYRKGLCAKLDDIRRESKEWTEFILDQMRNDRADFNNQIDLFLASVHSNGKDQKEVCDKEEKRIRNLEHSKAFISGAIALITIVLIPIAMAVLK